MNVKDKRGGQGMGEIWETFTRQAMILEAYNLLWNKYKGEGEEEE